MRRIDQIDFADNIYKGTVRQPKFKILLFDRSDPLYKIVLGNYTQVPIDLTQNLSGSLTITEKAQSAATLSATLTKDYGLTPNHFLGSPIIQVLETDRRILIEYGEVWVSVFTGVITGQPGFTAYGRESFPKIHISACDRSWFYNKRNLASENFDQGTDFGDVGVEIATNTEYGLSLQREEVAYGVQGHAVQHEYISIREVPMIEGLNMLFFPLDKYVTFGGDGRLMLRDMSITKPPARIYENFHNIVEIKWAQENVEIYNQVRIIGLDSEISKQAYPRQIIARTHGTVGFFTRYYKEKIYYSEDKTQRAELPRIEESSINGWISSLVPSDIEIISEENDFYIIVRIACPYSAPIFIAFFGSYLIAYIFAAIYPIAAPYIYLGASVQLIVVLALMQQLGQFDMEISAIPFELVYKEIEAVANWSHLEDYEIREKVIENHLIHSQEMADTIAQRELEKETILAHPRSITMLNDPFLEVDDIIEIQDGSKYYIKQITRKYNRESTNNMALRAVLISAESDDS